MPSNSDNPYANATSAYDNHAQTHTSDQRELEARILLKANRMFKNIIDKWDTDFNMDKLEEALKYNRKIWVLFYDTAIENKEGSRPNDLRSNIINLANFIFKREMEILSSPEKQKLNILININKEISAGLMTKQDQEQKVEKNQSLPAENHTQTDISS